MKKKNSENGKGKRSLPVRILAVFVALSMIFTLSGFQSLEEQIEAAEMITENVYETEYPETLAGSEAEPAVLSEGENQGAAGAEFTGEYQQESQMELTLPTEGESQGAAETELTQSPEQAGQGTAGTVTAEPSQQESQSIPEIVDMIPVGSENLPGVNEEEVFSQSEEDPRIETETEPGTDEEKAEIDAAAEQTLIYQDGRTDVLYSVKIRNMDIEKEAVTDVKVLLPEILSFDRTESADAPAVVDIAKMLWGGVQLPTSLNLDELDLENETDRQMVSDYANGQAVLWVDQILAAGQEKEYVFRTTIDAEETEFSREALRAVWLINGERLEESRINWGEDQDLRTENETGSDTENAAEEVNTELEAVPVYGDGQLSWENDVYKVAVDYTAEAQIPAGARLEAVQRASEDEAYQTILNQIIWEKLEADGGFNSNTLAADVFDLSILGPADSQDNTQPAAPVQATVTVKATDENLAEGTLEVRTLGEPEQILTPDEQNTVCFTADTLTGFAVDWVKEEEIVQNVTAGQVEITAAYPRSAFPADVQLQAAILNEENTGAEELAAYDALVAAEAESQGLNASKRIYFDISFLDENGTEFEPNDQVKISMRFLTPETGEEITGAETEEETQETEQEHTFLVLDPEDNQWKSPEEVPLEGVVTESEENESASAPRRAIRRAAEEVIDEEETETEATESQWLLLHFPDDGGVENLTDEISTQISTNEENALVEAEFVSGEFSVFGGVSCDKNDEGEYEIKEDNSKWYQGVAIDSEWAFLRAHLQAGHNVTLTGNITATGPRFWSGEGWLTNNTVKIEKVSTLDLNGFTITDGRYEGTEDTPMSEAQELFEVTSTGNFTVKSTRGTGTINLNGQQSCAVNVNGGILDLTGTNINSNDSTLSAITIKSGTATIGNGAIINNNKSKMHGGAITVESGTLTLKGNAEISNNRVGTEKQGHDGGGIYAGEGTTINIQDNAVISGNFIEGDNNSGGSGGGIWTSGTVNMTGGSIRDNRAHDWGGGIGSWQCTAINLSGTASITGNSLDAAGNAQGGGICVGDKGSITIGDSSVISNNTAVKGGGIYATGSATITMNGGSINNNHANPEDTSGYNGRGGGIFVSGNALQITGGEISNNDASTGGGIYAEGAAKVSMSAGRIADNYATSTTYEWGGGGVQLYGNASFELSNGEISGNIAETGGGGVRAGGTWGNDVTASFTMNGGSVTGNIAQTSEGGGISINKGCTGTISSGIIRNNQTYTTKDWGGGGVFCSDGGTIYLTNVLISNNDAGGFGGGLAGCSTGRVFTFGPDGGGAIYNNSAAGTHLAEGSIKTEDKTYGADIPNFTDYGFQDYFCAYVSTVSNSMLGGGYENWTGSIDGKPVSMEGNVTKINGEVVSEKGEPLVSSYSMGLTAHPTKIPDDSFVSVYIQNNSSNTHGGGIMCNGILIIGTTEKISVPRPVELVTKKAQKDENGEPVNLVGGEYTFIVAEDDNYTKKDQVNWNTPVLTGWNEKNGTITFPGRLIFDDKKWETINETTTEEGEEVKTFYYYVKENAGGDTNTIYDDTVYKITISIRKHITSLGNISKTEYIIADKGNGIIVEKSDPTSGEFGQIPDGYRIFNTNTTNLESDIDKDDFTTMIAFPCTGKILSDHKNPNGGGALWEPDVKDTFTNIVSEGKAGLILKGLKNLDGVPSTQAFSFKIDVTGDNAGNVKIPDEYKSVINDKNGFFTFKNISFSAEGDYTLTVKEVVPTDYDENVKYDWQKTYTVKVHVGKNSDKDLEVTEVKVSMAGSGSGFSDQIRSKITEGNEEYYLLTTADNVNPTSSFDNTASGILNLKGMKHLDGVASQVPFTFHIAVDENATDTHSDNTGSKKSDKVIIPPKYQTVQNIRDGIFTFADIRFLETGTYVLNITEQNENDESVTYDQSKYILTVKVGLVNETIEGKNIQRLQVTDVSVQKKDANGGDSDAVPGTWVDDAGEHLYYKITGYDGNTGATFSNTTGANLTLKGRKDLNNDINTVPSTKPFTFRITAEGDNAGKVTIPNPNVQNGTNGVFAFENISFKEAGDYVLKVWEEEGNVTGITTYDKTIYTLNVHVEIAQNASDKHLEATITSVQNASGQDITGAWSDEGGEHFYKITNYNTPTSMNPNPGGTATFTNTTEKPKEAILALTGLKDVDNIHSSEQYRFKIEAKGTNADKVTIKESLVQNEPDGVFAFRDIGFKEAGNYELKIKEVPGSDSSVIYDGSTYTVQVEIINDNGTLKVKEKGVVIKKDGESTEFISYERGEGTGYLINDYNPNTSVPPTFNNRTKPSLNLKGLKTLNGEPSKEPFKFTIEATGDNAGNVEIPNKYKGDGVNNATDGIFTFEDIRFSEAGTYVLQVREDGSADKPGTTYDGSSYEVTVKVEDIRRVENINGFENTRISLEVSSVSVQKKDANNNNDGNAREIKLELVKRYPDNPNNDEFVCEVPAITDFMITDYDPENGTNPTFANTREVKMSLKGMKYLDNTPSGIAFTFKIKADQAQEAVRKVIIPDESKSVTNSIEEREKGIFAFKNITFTEAGTYVLTVTEDASSLVSGITYDKSIYKVTVVVNESFEVSSVTVRKGSGASYSAEEDNADGYYKITNYDGDTYDGDTDPTFNNSSKPEEVSITLKGMKALNSNPSTTAFKFNIEEVDKDGKTFNSGKVTIPDKSKTVQNATENVLNDDGTVKEYKTGIFAFEDITFAAAGTYYFKVTEDTTTNSDPSIQYDTSNYVVKVEVIQEGILLKVNKVTVTKNNVEVIFSDTNPSPQPGGNWGSGYLITYYNPTIGGAVTFNNTKSYTMPETGGPGTLPYTLAGLLLTLGAACLMYIRSQRKKGGQRS